MFHPHQKNINTDIKLSIRNKKIKQVNHIKYLGVFLDSHVTCKNKIEYIVKKVKRSIGILSKLRYYVNSDILINLHYALIYPFIAYGLIIWGNYHIQLST